MPKKLRPKQFEAFAQQRRETNRSLFVEDLKNKGFDAHDDGTHIHVTDQAGGKAKVELKEQQVFVTSGENRKTTYTYTSDNKLSRIKDPAGLEIGYKYDDRGRLKSIRRGKQPPYQFEYDLNGDVSSVESPDGSKIGMARTQTSETITNADGSQSERIFDTNGLQKSFKDSSENETKSRYSGFNSPASVEFPEGLCHDFEYTTEGHLRKMFVNNRLHAQYAVDEDAGTLTIDFADGTKSEFELADGRVTKAQNEFCKVEIEYDDQGNILAEEVDGQKTTFERDELGNLIGITTPEGEQLSFERDNEHRVKLITDWLGGRYEIAYHKNGALAGISYPNGVTLASETTVIGLMKSMTVDVPSNPRAGLSRSWEFDDCDRVVSETTANGSRSFDYNEQGRLIRVESPRPFDSEQFELDMAGNIVRDGQNSCVVNGLNQLVSRAGQAFEYDGLGNMTRGATSKGTGQFIYNGRGQLITAVVGGKTIKFEYDPFGRRTRKIVGNRITTYGWAGRHLLSETTTENKKPVSRSDYLNFPERHMPLAMRKDDQAYYLHSGRRAEPVAMTDSTSQVVWQAEYSAYGRVDIKINDVPQPWRLSGQYHDTETGLNYVTARYMIPETGRFMSLDPLRFGGGSDNFYMYCDGDPLNYIDPTGEFLLCAILVGAAIGAAIGAGVAAYKQKVKRDAARNAGEPVPDYDWGDIGKAAAIGGVIGAIGGGVGAAVEAAVGATTLVGMAGAGALSGAVASVAEQCAEMAITGKDIPPGEFLKNTAFGAGIGLVTGPIGGLIARRARKGASDIAEQALKNADGGSKGALKTLSDFKAATRGKFASDSETATAWKVYQESSKANKTLVAGRLADTEAAELAGFQRLSTSGWTPAVNDAWVQGAIDAGKPIKLVSPVNKSTLVNPPGSRFPHTVFRRELQQLKKAGYTIKDGWALPPGS